MPHYSTQPSLGGEGRDNAYCREGGREGGNPNSCRIFLSRYSFFVTELDTRYGGMHDDLLGDPPAHYVASYETISKIVRSSVVCG